MRLPINPWLFLARLVGFFFLTYLAWKPLAPLYAQFLLRAAQAGVWATEFSSDPVWNHATLLQMRPERSPTAIFYSQRTLFERYGIPPQGIPAEWVMANLVLLIPLMLATPAPSWRARGVRLAVALLAALVLQVFDIVVTIKAFYAATFRGAWSPFAVQVYQFFDAFVQSWDTQLFPFAIWAGIHFRFLLGGRLPATPVPASAAVAGPARAERRRQGKAKR